MKENGGKTTQSKMGSLFQVCVRVNKFGLCSMNWEKRGFQCVVQESVACTFERKRHAPLGTTDPLTLQRAESNYKTTSADDMCIYKKHSRRRLFNKEKSK